MHPMDMNELTLSTDRHELTLTTLSKDVRLSRHSPPHNIESADMKLSMDHAERMDANDERERML